MPPDHRFLPDAFFPPLRAERLQERLSGHDAPHPVAAKCLSDMHGMQKRLRAMKNAHRESVQWITRGEMQALGSNAALSEAVYLEIQRLWADEAKDQQP